jgi:hypothetical protein
MTWTQYNPDQFWEEVQPSRTMRVRKQIWNDEKQEFQPMTFIRFFYVDSREKLHKAREYHHEQYGAPSYLGAWWADDHSVWLRESLATFWMLKNL